MAESYSHPDQPVRHSYPLAVADDSVGTAVKLCLRTVPFIGLQLAILVGFTVATIIWFVVTAGLGALVGKVNEGAGAWTFLIGLGAPAGVFWWLQRYILYMLKLAHVAVLTRLITHGDLEAGTNQIQYGKDRVAALFGEANICFVLD